MTIGISALFAAAKAAPYEVSHGRQQIMLRHDGRKVGGWNTRDRHWYVSKVIARDSEGLLERHRIPVDDEIGRSALLMAAERTTLVRSKPLSKR